VIEYGITLKVSKYEYKIRYNFMGNTLVFHVLYINILNYRYFHIDCSTFFKNKKRWKNKKNVKKRVFYRKIKNVITTMGLLTNCIRNAADLMLGSTHLVTGYNNKWNCLSDTCKNSSSTNFLKSMYQ